MPLYEYYCEKCKSVKEVLKSYDKYDEEENCANCKEIMIRKINTSSLNFNGSGYYTTDYAHKKFINNKG